MPAPYEGLGVFYLGRPVDPATAEVAATPVLYDAAGLTTHAFIVGMTGSGKTSLGVGLLKEAALDGIPVIAIDPKGDLGNLALQFPSLHPSDFHTWIDASEEKEALRTSYAKRLDALDTKMQQAETATDRESEQATQRKMDTVVRVGATLLGAFLGGGRRRSTLSQVGVTARSAGRASKEMSDVKRADEKLHTLKAEYADLDVELPREMDAIDLTLAPETAPLETVEIAPKQTDMTVTEMALAWVPCTRDADDRLTRSLSR